MVNNIAFYTNAIYVDHSEKISKSAFIKHTHISNTCWIL